MRLNHFLSVLIMMSFVSCATKKNELSIVHYNIKELSSDKMTANNEQIESVKEVLSKLDYDLLSLNEIQYDVESEGKNIKKLQELFGIPNKWSSTFVEANTGKKAKKLPSGKYASADNAFARSLADQDNYGLFPGQYSTGLLSRYPIVSEKHYTNVLWKDFNVGRDFSAFKDASGNNINPNLELFDKSFSDVVIQVGEHQVHVILLHTVPAYHFGNMQSPNFARNQDQLRFLEWYLTGKTDIEVEMKDIEPLKKGSYYVAMGDFNVEITALDNPGSEVLWRLKESTNFWSKDLSYSFEADGFQAEPLRLMLDYIIVSPNLEVVEGKIVNNRGQVRTELGCDDGLKEKVLTIGKHQQIAKYRSKGKACSSVVNNSDLLLKKASDHFPLFAKIRFPNKKN